MGKYFGTDGFRGEAGITLTADHAYKVGRFLGWYYNALRERNGNNEPARIVIGKDTRRMAIEMKQKGVLGKPCPDYVNETVSMKVVRIIQGYVNVVNKMVWRKY